MIVTQLSLTNFRNYETAEVELFNGPNLFVGSNGQGKTNLIEALGYLSTLRSHRTSIDQAMILQGNDSAVIRANLKHGDRQILVEVELNRSTANRAQINRSQIKLRELPHYFSSVLFAPEDLALVRGEPAGRRRYLDELLMLRTPRLAGVMTDYDRVLKQRNSLLKSARASRVKTLTTLDIWDERLVVLGAQLVEARCALIADLLPEVQAAYEAVAGTAHHPDLSSYLSIFLPDSEEPSEGSFRQTAHMTERPSAVQAEAAFRSALSQVRRSELDRGLTLVGPHRDDMVLSLNSLPARGYASHGESWSFALALKLASAAILRRESSSGDPVVILDDVFAELDQSRRARLAESVGGFEQVLITAAVHDDVPPQLAAHVVWISSGKILKDNQ